MSLWQTWLCLGPFGLSWDVSSWPFANMLNKSESTRIGMLWGWVAEIVFSDNIASAATHATWVTRRGFTRRDESRSKSENRSLVIKPLREMWVLWGLTTHDIPDLQDRILTICQWWPLASSDTPELTFGRSERVPFEKSVAEPRGSPGFRDRVWIRGMSPGDVWYTHMKYWFYELIETGQWNEKKIPTKWRKCYR